VPGVVQAPVVRASEPEEVEVDVLALALQMCPPGEAIEIHEAHCECIPCTCVPRVIVKPHPS
jgi:hypothetical protein